VRPSVINAARWESEDGPMVRIRQLVRTGAEIAQWHLDGAPVGISPAGEPDNVLPLARDTARLETDAGDGTVRLWLRPLYGVARYDEHADEQPLFDGPAHAEAPIPVAQLVVLDSGTVRVDHFQDDVYSLISPVSDPARAETISEWDRGRVLG
jgi:hypothetical protein